MKKEEDIKRRKFFIMERWTRREGNFSQEENRNR